MESSVPLVRIEFLEGVHQQALRQLRKTREDTRLLNVKATVTSCCSWKVTVETCCAVRHV
eukprot:6420525-Amphidinium_carterae.1